MKTQTIATPRPWSYPTDCGSLIAGDSEIALIHGANRKANAALIVTAVNEREALLAVAEAHASLLSHVQNFQEWIRDGKSAGNLFVNLDTTRDRKALATLAAVRKEDK